MPQPGTTRTFHLTVTEPEPGRVLSETDAAQDVTTTFIIDPVHNGEQCRVTIAVQGKIAPGLLGIMEKLFNPSIMRHIFRVELKQIADYMLSREVYEKV